MRIAPRADLDVQRFIALANMIGMRSFESVVEHSHYCDIINRPEFPENQIFLLRQATATEFKRLDIRIPHHTDDKMAAAFTELKALAKTAFPEQIATFRIVRSDEHPSRAFLANMYGEESETRPIEYFRPTTKAAIKLRCLSLGGYVWCGAYRIFEPFYAFCLGTANLAASGDSNDLTKSGQIV